MKSIKNWIVKNQRIVFLLAVFFVAGTSVHCSSGSGPGGGTTDLSAGQKAEVGNLISAWIGLAGFIGELLDGDGGAAKSQFVVTEESCDTSGSITVDETDAAIDLIFNDCTNMEDTNGDGTEDETDTVNGTAGYTKADGALTMDVSVALSFTEGDPSSFTLVGTGTLTESGASINASGIYDGQGFTMTGSITVTEPDMINGTVDFLLGFQSVRCTYTDFDVSELSASDLAGECVLI